jgi:GT2 family glycosyltransferase
MALRSSFLNRLPFLKRARRAMRRHREKANRALVARRAAAPPAGSLAAGDWNAVVNPALEGGAVGVPDGPSGECAPGWLLEPVAGAAASVRQVAIRPGHGSPAATSPGVALARPAAAGPVRLLVALDKRRLAGRAPAHLSFFAAPTSAGGDLQRIEAVMIVRRRRGAFGAGERRLCTIAHRLRIPTGGFFFEFAIPVEWQASVQAAAIRGRDEANVAFFASFEFAGAVDCAIAGLRLGPGPADLGRERGLALEDPNIAAQVALVEGIAHWDTPEALRSREDSRNREAALRKPSEPRGGEVEIVICVHDALEETLACLDSVFRNSARARRVTAVDDGSSPATLATLRAVAARTPRARLIELGERRGYTKAANVGLRAATADWVVLLNSDTLVSPGWLEGMLDAAERAGAAFVGPLSNAATWQSVPDVRDAAGRWMVNPMPPGHSVESLAALIARLSPRAAPSVPLLNGFCMLMRREALAELGFLDERAFPMGYGEETDLCLRAVAAGHRLALADHVYVHHVKSASFGGERAALSRRGNDKLKAKHPTADLQALQREMAEIGALAQLRARLRERLAASGSPSSKIAS